MSLTSKLSRAVVAYLVSANAVPAANAYPVFYIKDRIFPNVTVIPGAPRAEIRDIGNRRFTLSVSIKASSAGDSQQGKIAARIAFDALCSTVRDALMQSEAGSETIAETGNLINVVAYAKAAADTNDADLTQFTITQWLDLGEGAGRADEEGCDWELVYQFDVTCCDSQIAGYTS